MTHWFDQGLYDRVWGFRGVGRNLKVVRLKGGLGVVPPAEIKGVDPVGGGQGAKSPEASTFLKMRLEFVQQVDGTIITKLVIKSFFFFLF